MTPSTNQLGAILVDSRRAEFLLWAPQHKRVDLQIVGPQPRTVAMSRMDDGYHRCSVQGAAAGMRYAYLFADGKSRPDPASRSQPDGVHAPSELVDPRFEWTDHAWRNHALDAYVIYELHVGTFTQRGSFDSAIEHFSYLRDLGVTAIELMPVSQFPGPRNWGYDGVFPFAVQNSYGGMSGLQRVVDAAHACGLAVVLDVVYNHLGPEGNHLRDFAPYFTQRYRTPWGDALNFDGAHSDHVRRFFIESAEFFVRDCHVDAFRVDAVHAIADTSAYPFLRELNEQVHGLADRLGRRVHMIAESADNNPLVIAGPAAGGLGFDAQWNDDFHHVLHALITGEAEGYYASYQGGVEQLAKAISDGFVLDGGYSPFHQRRHGRSSRGLPGRQFVIFAQNHDQIGNRMMGDRLSAAANLEQLKIIAATVLLAPFVPLLFMGEEYGETAPFMYFVSHSDQDLIEAVRRGRREEFAQFDWQGEPPDPQAEATFRRCVLNHELRRAGANRTLLEFHRELLRLRRAHAPLRALDPANVECRHAQASRVMTVIRRAAHEQMLIVLNFSDQARQASVEVPPGRWIRCLDSASSVHGGSGERSPACLDVNGSGAAKIQLAAHSLALYQRDYHALPR